MFKKNKKSTENVKEKKVRTVKVGTHKKTVIALWVVLIASVSFTLMGVDLIPLLLLVFIYLLIQIYAVYYRIKYDKEM